MCGRDGEVGGESEKMSSRGFSLGVGGVEGGVTGVAADCAADF